MLQSPPAVDKALDELKEAALAHRPRISAIKNMVVKSQKFEEADKLRRVEVALDTLLQRIEDAYIKFGSK